MIDFETRFGGYITIVANTSELDNLGTFDCKLWKSLSSLFQTEILDAKLGLTETKAKAQVILGHPNTSWVLLTLNQLNININSIGVPTSLG